MGAGRLRATMARAVLAPTSGFIREAGFTHSLSPARNCTFGCVYCYVPTMRIQGGLQREDWEHWGRHTTVKSNTAELLQRTLRAGQRIYCSPLVDPYQPAEAEAQLMPGVLDAVAQHPPAVFCVQTRGVLIVRDLDRLREAARRTRLRISFSITTNREDVRRWYEPHCDSIAERLAAVRRLRESGLCVYCTLAPILPCDPEHLAELALDASGQDLVLDPFHTRAAKRRGATTRPEALRVSERRGFMAWHEPAWQAEVVARIAAVAQSRGRRAGAGAAAFAWLAAEN